MSTLHTQHALIYCRAYSSIEVESYARRLLCLYRTRIVLAPLVAMLCPPVKMPLYEGFRPLSRVIVNTTRPVNTFLVPDISGEGAEALVKAARQSAAAMSSFELVARTAIEIVGVWVFTYFVTGFIRSLCDRAGRVSCVSGLSCHPSRLVRPQVHMSALAVMLQ